jgi:hypothetical protein
MALNSKLLKLLILFFVLNENVELIPLNETHLSRMDSIDLINFNIKWQSIENAKTKFVITSKLNTSDVNNAWLGIGFNIFQSMDEASVIVCKSGEKSGVEHYYNDGYSSSLMDTNNPTIGISGASVQVNNQTISCSFTRDNDNSNENYCDINDSAYLLVAYGTLTDSSIIFNHNLFIELNLN